MTMLLSLLNNFHLDMMLKLHSMRKNRLSCDVVMLCFVVRIYVTSLSAVVPRGLEGQ